MFVSVVFRVNGYCRIHGNFLQLHFSWYFAIVVKFFSCLAVLQLSANVSVESAEPFLYKSVFEGDTFSHSFAFDLVLTR